MTRGMRIAGAIGRVEGGTSKSAASLDALLDTYITTARDESEGAGRFADAPKFQRDAAAERAVFFADVRELIAALREGQS